MAKSDSNDVFERYETGKHRRYALLFTVNGGAFAIVSLLVQALTKDGELPALDQIAGQLTLRHLAVGMAIFTIVMAVDIWFFGQKMRKQDKELFAPIGKLVLISISALIVVGWLMAAAKPG